MVIGSEITLKFEFWWTISPSYPFLKRGSTTKDILSVCQILWYIPSFGVWSKVNRFSSFDEIPCCSST